ncbi:NAD(P)H-dependent oxidoreductase [Variovorax boronicumulans]|uniref:NAD(P)H-dependent oxidoreductase n=1 Tax=Variovorax boronicumulans TaxID=436515 RepID=UPI00278A9A6E|nr:NAD(P)H-dependent oxidoreductase [Variovorax boronicumulans]MDQ0041398.1 NAD(P)H dehydrogenase (quinone) [Variovorax boronicumulans]
MHALIVVSHPDSRSLTHAVARSFAEGVEESGKHTTEIADIAAEGFQAAFNQADRAAYFLQKPLPPDILREQERIDRADALVLVYPVYWWSFPGQLKGWIDRVFSNGWAYDEAPDGTLGKRLGRLAVHLIGIGGADGGTYARHGYDKAMRTQIDHGIFDAGRQCVCEDGAGRHRSVRGCGRTARLRRERLRALFESSAGDDASWRECRVELTVDRPGTA